MSEKSWDDRFAELLERIMALDVAGSNSKPLKEEMKKLLAERPLEKKDVTAKNQPVPADGRRPRRARASRP